MQALRLSEASFRSVVEGAPYAICRANFEGRLLQLNPALQKILGYESADEMIRTILGSDVFQRADDFQKLIELLRTTGEFHDVEAEWKRKDGGPITVMCSGRSLDEHHDTSPGFEVFAEDVTARRVLERQLRMAAKMEAVG